MATLSINRPLAAPHVDAATENFWAETKEGRLCTRVCKECGKLHWYPRSLCPFCLGETDWQPLCGRGIIYSVSVTRKAGPVPYALAYVALEEGITMLTNIVDCDLDSLKIGQRVSVVFKAAEDGAMIPMFQPSELAE